MACKGDYNKLETNVLLIKVYIHMYLWLKKTKKRAVVLNMYTLS